MGAARGATIVPDVRPLGEHEIRFPDRGWSAELTEEFVFLWLEDWYQRGAYDCVFEQQMNEYCAAVGGVTAREWTAALVEDLAFVCRGEEDELA